MKRIGLILFSGILILGLTSSFAYAVTVTVFPDPSDLNDLDHGYYYLWAFSGPAPSGVIVTSATLHLNNIDNWDNNPNWLFIHLVDNPYVPYNPLSRTPQVIGSNFYSSTLQWYDGQGEGDNWIGNPEIATYIDSNGTGNPESKSYVFDSSLLGALNSYAQDGNFGIGFDPDCHFNNLGISLEIRTSVIPEPATMSLLGIGLLSMVGLRRKRT